MVKRTKRGLIESAKRFLDEGETVREVYLGQTYVTPLMYLLVAPIVFIFMVKPRAVMTTDRNVYVLKRSMWKGKQVDECLLKQPLGEATIETTPLALSISGGEKLYAMLTEFDDKRAVAERIEGAGSAAEIEPAAG